MSSNHGQTLLKPRSTKVKPMLKKLAQSEQNSLDLDRPAPEADAMGVYDFGGGRPSYEGALSPGRRDRGYHNRSTSGTSQFSTATSTSGTRAGPFVHPFQQTPRPYTPPQDSLRESDHTNSPEPAEDEEQQQYSSRRPSSTATPTLPSATNPTARPNPTPLLRLQTSKQSSRIPQSASYTGHSSHLSPLSPVDLTSSIDSMTPATTFRSSFDKGFRLRSRSDLDSRDRITLVHEARRKFMEKEMAKDEKAAREEIRQREKRDQKEAQKIDRAHRRSSASDGLRTGTGRTGRSKSDLTMGNEKQGGINEELFAQYAGAPRRGAAAVPLDHTFRNSSATNNAKKKTHSAWTKLMMWIRTRLIRMKGKKQDPPPATPPTFYAYGSAQH